VNTSININQATTQMEITKQINVYTRWMPNGELILSDRQEQIIRLICDGVRGNVIASRLGLAVKTVENHRNNITMKLRSQGVDGTATMVKWAIVTGTYQL
jgi:DNA-binding NarL/FixJ family response regulator